MRNLATIFVVVLVVAGGSPAMADDIAKLKLAKKLYDTERSEDAFVTGMKLGSKQVMDSMINTSINHSKEKSTYKPGQNGLEQCLNTKAYDKYIDGYTRSILPLDKIKLETSKIYVEEFSEEQMNDILKSFPAAEMGKILNQQSLTAEETKKVEEYKNSDIGKFEISKLPEITQKIKDRIPPIIEASQKDNIEAMQAGKPPANAKDMEAKFNVFKQECEKELGIKIITQPATNNQSN